MSKRIRAELKARKQAYVQDEIIAAAANLFAERGVRAVTIDDIASSLGYTKSVIYYYFNNKNQVVWEIFNRIHAAWSQDTAAIVEQDMPPDRMLAALIRRHALNVMERTAWTAIYFRDQSELTAAQQKTVRDRKRQYDERLKEVYERGVATGIFRNIPANLIVSSIIGTCNMTHMWFKPSGRMTPAEIAEHYVTILMQGCLDVPARA
jgi:AcrR family transcriptional regulator